MSDFTREARFIYEREHNLPLGNVPWQINEAVRAVADYVAWAGRLGPYAAAVQLATPVEQARRRRNVRIARAMDQEGLQRDGQ